MIGYTTGEDVGTGGFEGGGEASSISSGEHLGRCWGQS